MRKRLPLILMLAAMGAGLAIAWIDSRPRWDDTGITVGLLVLAAAVFGALRPDKPWLWGLAVGIWIPLVGISRRNPGTLIALAAALFGAYLGALLRKALGPPAKGLAGR